MPDRPIHWTKRRRRLRSATPGPPGNDPNRQFEPHNPQGARRRVGLHSRVVAGLMNSYIRGHIPMNTKYIPMRSETTLESLPVDPSLLDRANWWFDVSWYGLLWAGAFTALAACATVIFLFLQYWSSGVRERQSDWRTSSLELQAKRADADLARANADIAAADARAAEANARALEAQAELARFKSPRMISDSDKRRMISSLSKFSGTDAAIYVLGDGPEPNGLAASISDMLTQSHWQVLSWNWSGAGAATGVIVVFKPGSAAEIEATCEALASALNSAHITSTKEPWPGDWEQVGGMLNGPNPPAPTAAPIRIVIGTKPQ
jgi:hypothetical protein